VACSRLLQARNRELLSSGKWSATTAAAPDLVLSLTGFARETGELPRGQSQLTSDDADQLGRTNDDLGDLSAA